MKQKRDSPSDAVDDHAGWPPEARFFGLTGPVETDLTNIDTHLRCTLMRTTIILNDELARAAKRLAVEERSNLSKIVNEGLRLRLNHHAEHRSAAPFVMPTFGGGGKPVDTPSSKFRELDEETRWIAAET